MLCFKCGNDSQNNIQCNSCNASFDHVSRIEQISNQTDKNIIKKILQTNDANETQICFALERLASLGLEKNILMY